MTPQYATGSPLKRTMQHYPLLSFFALAYLLSWVMWLPLYWAPAAHLQLPHHHALGALGPLAAAFIVTSVLTGAGGRWELLGSMLRWDVHFGWYLLVLLGPLALAVLAVTAAALVQAQPLDFSGLGRAAEYPGFGIVLFFLYNVLTFGYGEETGWRGFALPRLQQRYGNGWATLLLTLGWAGWHLPLFLYRPGYTGMDLAGAAGWLLSLLTGSVLLSWIFNGTRGSVLLCALFHATIDLAFTSRGISPLATSIMGAVITIASLIVYFRLRKMTPVLAEPAGV